MKSTLITVVAVVAGGLVSAAVAQTTPKPLEPVKHTVAVPADLGWIEGLPFETGITVDDRGRTIINNAIKIVALKESLSERVTGAGTTDENRFQVVGTVTVLAEPSLASVGLRKRLLGNNLPFSEFTIVNYRGAGGRYYLGLENAKIKSVGTSSFQGRIVDEYVFHDFDDMHWHYTPPGDELDHDYTGANIRDGVVR